MKSDSRNENSRSDNSRNGETNGNAARYGELQSNGVGERDLHYLRILLGAGNFSAATTYYAGLKNCTLSEARAALKAMLVQKPATPPNSSHTNGRS